MKNPALAGLACIPLLTLTGTALAHGGVYRGPEDVVPPNTSGPQPKSPGAPTTGGPTAPGPRGPGGPTT